VRRLAGLLHAHFSRELRNDELIQTLNQRLKEERSKSDAGAQKQDDTVGILTQKLKDEQKRGEALQSKQEETIVQLNQKLKDEQRRADLLQQKLDALTNIEKAIVDRQQKPNAEPKK
jgi:uncharacterized coiled-coil protein SlyX